jgi:hypothetical protein
MVEKKNKVPFFEQSESLASAERCPGLKHRARNAQKYLTEILWRGGDSGIMAV